MTAMQASIARFGRAYIPGRIPPRAWPLVAMYIALALYWISPDRGRFPAVLVTLACFGLIPTFLPGAQPNPRTLFCPLNWTLLVFFLQLVVVPLLVCFSGPVVGPLPFLPSDHAINVALLLSALAFTGFCFGYGHSSERRQRRRAFTRGVHWQLGDAAPVLYFALGVLGVLLAFHSIGSLLSYFAKSGHPGVPVEPVLGATSSSASLVASLFLRPFLGFGAVLLWCRWLDRRDTARPVECVVLTLATAAAVVVSYSTFGYNRGAFVAPVIALLAVYGRRVRHMSLATIVVLGVLALVLLTAYRYYRTTTISLGQAVGAKSTVILKGVHVNKELQEYGDAPQFTGYLLEQSGYASSLHYGSTLVASGLSPIPRLGIAFRASTGNAFYNRLVYGALGTHDQLVPLDAELFINFWWPGVAFGFVLFGILVARLQGCFERASTSLEMFVWQYAAVWVAYLVLGGIGPVSQVFIYFFWPAYAVAALTWLRRRRSMRDAELGAAVSRTPSTMRRRT